MQRRTVYRIATRAVPVAWGGDVSAGKVSARPKVTVQVRAGPVAANGAHRQV